MLPDYVSLYFQVWDPDAVARGQLMSFHYTVSMVIVDFHFSTVLLFSFCCDPSQGSLALTAPAGWEL